MTFPDSFVLLQQDGYLIRTSLSGDEGIEAAAVGASTVVARRLGFEQKRAETGMTNNGVTTAGLADAEILWKSADALRGQIDAAEYKHVVLGLLFLKYISDSFEAAARRAQGGTGSRCISGPQIESLLENRDEYTAERVFWVPPEARWQNLQNQAARSRNGQEDAQA